MRIRTHSAFTLVEALFGIVILGLVSTGSWYAVNTLLHTGTIVTSRNQGINLLQKSQEEVRKASRSFYDSLNNCQFPGPSMSNGNSTCGFTDISSTFPGYSRNLSVEFVNNSTELKKAVITIQWDEFNQHKTMQSAVLLARPPDPFPGNIVGTIRDCKNSNIILGGVTVKIFNIAGTFTRQIASNSTLSVKNVNYDFMDIPTGHFLLPVDTYTISATRSGYKNYFPVGGPKSPQIVVGTNSEVIYNFCMEPNPTDATLTVKLVNSANGNTQLPSFTNPGFPAYYGWTYIDDDGAEILSSSKVSLSTFKIPFTDTNPRLLTVKTVRAFNAGWAFKNTTVTGTPGPCAYNYSPEGWSSAVMQSDGSEICQNPYFGSATTDRISVSPGDNLQVTVPLVPVPTATIRGRVIDSNGHKIAGAKVQATWPTLGNYNGTVPILWTSAATTNDDGEYTYIVPATQELFANVNPDGFLKVQASGSVKVRKCCDKDSLANVTSQTEFVGPLFVNDSLNVNDLVLPVADAICGNARGKITDGATGGGINSAVVTIQSTNENTNNGGDYLYQCDNNSDGDNGNGHYRLPSGKSIVLTTKANYYSYTSAGNKWYSKNDGITILSGQTSDFNAKLWPIGYGNLTVSVVDAGATHDPIANAKVDLLKATDGSHVILYTDSSGQVTFTNIQETWPPDDLPSDTYYNHASSNHTITVTPPIGSNNTGAPGMNVIIKKNTTNVISVPLASDGAV